MQVCNQEVGEAAQADAAKEREQSVAGENVNKTRQGRVAADVHAESEKTADNKLCPLAHKRLPLPLAEGYAAIEPPVPTNRRPEGQETRHAVFDHEITAPMAFGIDVFPDSNHRI